MSIEVGDPLGQRHETIESHVDTRATYTTFPAPLLDDATLDVNGGQVMA